MTQVEQVEANLKAIQKNHKAAMKKLEAAQAVQISDHVEFHANGVTTYYALSTDGARWYAVNVQFGTAIDCECVSRCKCKHMQACELRDAFLAEWNAEEEEVTQVTDQVASAVLGCEFAQDLEQHIEDDLRTEAVYECVSCYGPTKHEYRVCGRCLDVAA